MYLLIASQDIHSLTLGLSEGMEIQFEVTLVESPEGFLSALNRFLHEQSVNLEQLKGVIVVTGPGSFTASRISTTIANGIAFTQSIPIFGLENPDRLDLAQLLAGRTFEGGASVNSSYDRPPLITQSNQVMGITSMPE
ncbi:hypothetical protein HQ487_00170 [Candidatus Uhrbacteria bacterium]|nr:hypothetical protein [Candidatus Uhrbacteria bacterium]